MTLHINKIDTIELTKILDNHKNNKYNIQSRKITNKLIIDSVRCGKLILIDYYRKNGDIYFIGKFIKTNYINSNIHYSQVKTGKIKDLTCPNFQGVGYLGKEFGTIKDRELHKILYIKWRNMINRCYNKKNSQYSNYGGAGIRVSNDWHSYYNYFTDVQLLKNYNREKVINGILTLDKDLKQQEIKKDKMFYSKETCIWLTTKEQNKIVNHDIAQDSLKRYFIAITPTGEEIIFKGLSKFAREHNLDSGDCSRALNGKIPHVKNYKFKSYKE